MPEEFGFRTPAKELENLRKRLEEVEGVSKYVTDAVALSLWALAWHHLVEAVNDPKNARKAKDRLLDALKKARISREVLDTLDTLCKMNCEGLEGKTA